MRVHQMPNFGWTNRVGLPKNVPLSHKNIPPFHNITCYFDTAQQDKQFSRTFLWDKGMFYWYTQYSEYIHKSNTTPCSLSYFPNFFSVTI